MRLSKGVRWQGALGLSVTFLLISCANSPSDDLARVQNDLKRLEQQGADAYLPEQIGRARDIIKLAHDSIQRNHFEQAGKSLKMARSVLDSCAAVLMALRAEAKRKSEAQFAQLQSSLDSLALVLDAMPKQSYLDQNRYDLHSLKLISMRQEMEALRTDIERKDYPSALDRGQLLQRRLRKSLALLQEQAPSPVIAVSNSASR